MTYLRVAKITLEALMIAVILMISTASFISSTLSIVIIEKKLFFSAFAIRHRHALCLTGFRSKHKHVNN